MLHAPHQSILDNFLSLNPEIKVVDARFALARFLFKNQTVLKEVNQHHFLNRRVKFIVSVQFQF